MSVAVYVSGDVSSREVISAQEVISGAIHDGTSPDVRLIPSNLELGFDVNIALNTVSTLTSVAAFVYTLISAKQRSNEQPGMGQFPDDSDQAYRRAKSSMNEVTPPGVQASVQPASRPDGGMGWAMMFEYPAGKNYTVIVQRIADGEFDASIQQVRGD